MKGDPTAFIKKGTTLFYSGETTDDIPFFKPKDIFSGVTVTTKNASFLNVLQQVDRQQEKEIGRKVIITTMNIIESAPDETTS